MKPLFSARTVKADAPAEKSGECHGARHVAIIMDGNGRWAKKHHLPRAIGHKKGVEAVRTLARAAGDMGLQALTLYAFSSENWKRPADEVEHLMGLLRTFISKDIDELHATGVRLKIIGNYKLLSPDLVEMIDAATHRTERNERYTLAVALNYGAQDEMVRAMQALASQVAVGALDPAQINADMVETQLDTADLPPLDLLIRTSGEVRLSNFLLWQAAYAELYFTETLWPDFTPQELEQALKIFSERDRRYGGR